MSSKNTNVKKALMYLNFLRKCFAIISNLSRVLQDNNIAINLVCTKLETVKEELVKLVTKNIIEEIVQEEFEDDISYQGIILQTHG